MLAVKDQRWGGFFGTVKAASQHKCPQEPRNILVERGEFEIHIASNPVERDRCKGEPGARGPAGADYQSLIILV